MTRGGKIGFGCAALLILVVFSALPFIGHGNFIERSYTRRLWIENRLNEDAFITVKDRSRGTVLQGPFVVERNSGLNTLVSRNRRSDGKKMELPNDYLLIAVTNAPERRLESQIAPNPQRIGWCGHVVIADTGVVIKPCD